MADTESAHDALLQPAEMSPATLRKLIKATEANGFRLVDWQRLGRPAFERIVAHVEGPTDKVGSLVQSVVSVPNLRAQLKVFPRGIPAIDRVALEITAGH